MHIFSHIFPCLRTAFDEKAFTFSLDNERQSMNVFRSYNRQVIFSVSVPYQNYNYNLVTMYVPCDTIRCFLFKSFKICSL